MSSILWNLPQLWRGKNHHHDWQTVWQNNSQSNFQWFTVISEKCIRYSSKERGGTTEHFHKTQTIELRVTIFHLLVTDVYLATWLEFRVILRFLETASPNYSKFIICNTVNLQLFEIPFFLEISVWSDQNVNNHFTILSTANWWIGTKSRELA